MRKTLSCLRDCQCFSNEHSMGGTTKNEDKDLIQRYHHCSFFAELPSKLHKQRQSPPLARPSLPKGKLLKGSEPYNKTLSPNKQGRTHSFDSCTALKISVVPAIMRRSHADMISCQYSPAAYIVNNYMRHSFPGHPPRRLDPKENSLLLLLHSSKI